jgi:hypothetical protein
MTIQRTPTTISYGLRQKPQPSSAPRLQATLPGLPARVVYRIRRRAKPDRLLESFIFGFFRSGVRVALYLACAYAAKIALGIGHLSLALR